MLDVNGVPTEDPTKALHRCHACGWVMLGTTCLACGSSATLSIGHCHCPTNLGEDTYEVLPGTLEDICKGCHQSKGGGHVIEEVEGGIDWSSCEYLKAVHRLPKENQS